MRRVYLLLFFLILPIAFAESNESSYYTQQIVLAQDAMIKMQNNGFSIIRYNDTLLESMQLFKNQAVFEESNKSDYTLLKQKLNDLKLIESNAYLNYDELNALKQSIDSVQDINTSLAMELYYQAEASFKAERYEESLNLIDQAYEKISELEATTTKIKAMYDVTSRTIANFLKEHWKEILYYSVLSILLVALLSVPISNFRIKRHISSLEVRSQAIKSLIAKTQKEYFDHGTLSETTYHVRMKKYGELLRDINRQIPLLKEKLAMNKNMLARTFRISKSKKGELI
jgi:tetratricopeptide (TPR) repeat protein